MVILRVQCRGRSESALAVEEEGWKHFLVFTWLYDYIISLPYHQKYLALSCVSL